MTKHIQPALAVMVTGGASGIGAATVRRVVAAGGHAGIADIDEAGALALAKELGPRAVAVVCDAGNEASVAAAHDALRASMPPLNGLVASAAIVPKVRDIENTPTEEFWRVVDSHLRWTYIVCRVVGVAMAERCAASGGRDAGSIVTLASVLAYRPGPVFGYSEGKAGVVNLTQALAVQWAIKGVRVNAVAPGWTDTPFLASRKAGRDVSQITDHVPAGRLLDASEIAEVIYFLLSPASSAVTGATIPCDGGFLPGTGWGPYGGFPKRA